MTRAPLTIALTALLLLLAAPAHAARVFQGDLETGNLSQYGSSPWNFEGVSAPTVVRNPVRQGQYALAFRVPSGAKRQEVVPPSTLRFTEGMDRWFGWSYMFASDWPLVSNWQVVVQWKADGTGGPPVGMRTDGDRIQVRSGGDNIIMDAGPLTRGVWIDFVAHIRFSSDPAKSLVELWRDGKKLFSRGNWAPRLFPGSGTLRDGASHSYLKSGIYRDPGAPGTARLWSDDWRIGTSFQDVAPTGTPDDTEVPDKPGVPDEPAVPDKPEVPDQPEVPDETEVPDDGQVGAVWTPPTDAVVGEPVTFDGTASPGDPPITCTWEFTDRTGATVYSTGTGCVHEKTFVYPGRKYARLRVADEDGETRVSPVQTFYAESGTTTRLHVGAF